MPSAQFVINIAAEMPEGESTIAELGRLTANLMGSGKGAEHFQQAIKQASASLDAARAASVAANSALAAGETEYKQLERAALQAAKAEEKYARAGAADLDMYTSLIRASGEANSALNQHVASLKKLEAEAAGAEKKEKAFAASLDNVKKLSGHVDKTIASNAEKLGKLQGGLSAIGGPIGALGSKLVAPIKGFTELTGTMGTANASALVAVVGFGAVAVAVVAVSVVLAAATIAVASWAVGLADAKREAALATEAFEIMNPAVEALQGTIDGLTTTTGLSESALDGIAKSLVDAKVSAADLPAALEAAALAERALGNSGASDFLAKMKASKKSVQDFSAEAKDALGGVVAKQMMGLGAQSALLKNNIGRIFGGLDIDPVLRGFQKLVGLFDENTSAGQAMKFLFESVFQPLINQAENAATVIEAFALGFLIGLTKLYIALKPAIKAVSEFLGFHDPSLANALAFATKAGEYIAPVLAVAAVAFGVLAAAVLGAIAVVTLIQAAIFALPLAIGAAALALGGVFLDAWHSVTAFLSSIDLSTVGSQILQGLANGITGAAGFVVDAVGNAVKGAIKAAKHALGIASPSKVFAEIGDFTGQGFALGVDGTADQAQAAMADLVAPPDASTLSAQDSLSGNAGGGSAPANNSRAPNSTAAPSGGGISINLSGAVLTFNGVKDGPEALEQFKEMLTKVWEQEAGSYGSAEAA